MPGDGTPVGGRMSEVVPKMEDMLSDADRALLDFADSHPRHTGVKEDQIRVSLHMTSARFYQRLHWLLTQPEVVAEYPQLASRSMRSRQAQGSRRRWVHEVRRSA